jgi:hypothetical protein
VEVDELHATLTRPSVTRMRTLGLANICSRGQQHSCHANERGDARYSSQFPSGVNFRLRSAR